MIMMCAYGPNYGRERHFTVCSKHKNITDADSDDENEMTNATLVPMPSEMRNIMKSMGNYLDAHSNGEMNNKMDDIEPIVGHLMLKKTIERKRPDYFSKTQ
ncbi:uncharacterized protein TNCV_3967771 [Trichonephila clavipes]|nr:uncharacterized protein TNCV_3967771 [Trichonephila clavipes]